MRAQKYIIKDGAMASRVMELIGALDLERPWEVTIKRYVKKRSLDQNALYWKWIDVIHNETGQDADDVHEIMMRKFLEPRSVHGFGGANEIDPPLEIWSTRNLTTAEFKIYLDKILGWAAGFGILLPLPEEQQRTL